MCIEVDLSNLFLLLVANGYALPFSKCIKTLIISDSLECFYCAVAHIFSSKVVTVVAISHVLVQWSYSSLDELFSQFLCPYSLYFISFIIKGEKIIR